MKKTALALALTFTTLSSMAATTATLLLKGNVPQILSVAVTPETVAANLPLSVTQTNTKVATVNEKSNSSTGYKVTVSSVNQGKLIRSGGTQQFPYSLSYNGQGLNLASAVVLTNSAAAAVSVNKDVTISYTGVPNDQMLSGDYVDTITFAIAAN